MELENSSTLMELYILVKFLKECLMDMEKSFGLKSKFIRHRVMKKKPPKSISSKRPILAVGFMGQWRDLEN
jgi:hypothetical protein